MDIIVLFLEFYPSKSLELWVDAKRPSTGTGCEYAVLNWKLISWKGLT